VFRQQLF